MMFDINKYKGKYAMHCKTIIEAKDFCKHLHMLGRKWQYGKNSYLDCTRFDVYYSNTVYYFNEGLFGAIDCAKENNYTIIEWSDFMNKEFTKADLKTGDVVLQRDGKIDIVILDFKMLLTKTGRNFLREFNDDLTSVNGTDYDIVAVRRPSVDLDCSFDAFECKSGTLVYERKEVEEMTLEEVCKALGKKIKIVSKEAYGNTY